MSGTMVEPMYCSQQIIIPPTFPHVLKVFAKAAIRTQPYDLLLWSADYFKAMSEGRVPPVKERLEYPLIRSEGGLSPQYLKVLIKQLSCANEIESETLRKRWAGICLQENELKKILCTAGVYLIEKFPLYKFAAVAAGFLCKSLTQTMIMLCEIYTDEPDGGSAAISADFFVDLYTFLAAIDAQTEVTYYDGYREDVYTANEATKKEMVVEEGEEIIVPLFKDSGRWIPKLKGWMEESSVWETNLILGEPVPVEGGKVSRNLALVTRAPREKFTDPHAPPPAITPTSSEKLETVSPIEEEVESAEVQDEEATSDTQKLEEQLTEDLDSSKKSDESVEKAESEASAQEAEVEDKVEELEKSAEQLDELEQPDQPEETSIEVKEEEVLVSKETIIEEEMTKSVTEEVEEETPQLNRDHGVILRVFSEDGEKIESLSVASVDGKESVQGEGSEVTMVENVEDKSDEQLDEKTEELNQEKKEEEGIEQEEGSAEGSAKLEEDEEKEENEEKPVKPKLDVSVKEREAIIEKLEINQEKKVNAFMDAIESIENLAEKTIMLTYDADKIAGKELTVKSGEIIAGALEREILIMVQRPEKQDVHADAKGVVNPILGDFFNSFYELVGEVKDTHIPEVIMVPGKPGIGPAVDPSMVEEVVKYVRETGADQCDMFMPRDIRHCLCPPLERNGSVG